MAYKLVKTEGGKTNWGYIRHIFYTAIVVWAIGVRLMNVNPFDDIFAMKITPETVMDLLVLWALWMLVWFIAYPLRPRWNSTT